MSPSRRRRRKGESRGSNFAWGLAALIVIVPLVYLGFTKAIPFRHHFELKAAFRNANDVRRGSPVRIAGVNVGKVTSVDHLPGGGNGSVVTMRIEQKGLPIHTDATVAVRPRIFLEGNFFVDVRPGTPSAPIAKDGYTLPIQQASAPVQLDQILTSLQSDTRRNLQILLREYGHAVHAGGPGYNRSIAYWKAAYENLSLLNEAALGEHPHDLSGYIDRAGVVALALDQHPAELQRLITDFHTTSSAFARANGALAAAVAELPRTLGAARPALGALNAAFPSVRRLAAALRPGVRSTGPMIEATLPFIRQVRGLVQPAELRGLTADLRPTVPALARLQNASLALYPQVRLASSCQNEVILPWTHLTVPDKHFPAKGDVAYESVKFLPGIANESDTGDANGQWFRVLAGGSTSTYAVGHGRFGSTLAPIQGIEPKKPAYRPPIRPNVPCETQALPDLRTASQTPPALLHYDASTPAAIKSLATERLAAVKLMRKVVSREHLGLHVLDRLATKTDILSEARSLGR